MTSKGERDLKDVPAQDALAPPSYFDLDAADRGVPRHAEFPAMSFARDPIPRVLPRAYR